MKKNKNTILETAKQTIIAESNAISNLVQYLTKDFIDKTPEGEVLDELKLTKYCCRRHMLTHVDIE